MTRSLHIIMFAAVAPLIGVSFAFADTAVLLDGQSVDAKITAIADGSVRCGDQSIDLRQIRRLTFDAKADAAPAAGRVYLADGSVLIASNTRVGNQQCVIDWAYGKGVGWSMDQVDAILPAAPKVDAGGEAKLDPAFAEALANPHRVNDRLLVIADDRITAVDGALDELGDEQAVFVWQDQPRKVSRAKLYGIVLARGEAPADRAGWCLVHLADGSRLWGMTPTLDGNTLALARGNQLLSFPARAVVRIDVRSDRLMFLSDLDPTAVADDALFTFNGYQRDASVLRRPITLGKNVYEKGLGTHSPCRLTYALDGRFDTFAATIGVDDETYGRGDCIFKVALDDKTIFEKRMRGSDPPHALRLPIAGAKTLTLIVEIGEDLDLSDHADWADARLVREK